MTKQEMLDLLRKLDSEKLPAYEKDEFMFKGMEFITPDVETHAIVNQYIKKEELI